MHKTIAVESEKEDQEEEESTNRTGKNTVLSQSLSGRGSTNKELRVAVKMQKGGVLCIVMWCIHTRQD